MSESRARALWTKALEGVTSPTRLWQDRAPGRPGAADAPRRVVGRPGLDPRDIERGARAIGISPEIVWTGAWAILLARYSRETDVVFGLLPGREFADPHPVRVRVGYDKPAGDWLIGLDTESRELAAAGRVRLEQVREWCTVPLDLPLFESVLAPNLARHSPGPGWPLVVGSSADGALRAVGDETRFDEWTLVHTLDHLDRVLRQLLGQPTRLVGDISLMDEDERHLVVEDWNRTAVEHRNDATIPQLFAEQVAARPDAPAVVSDEGVITYAELDSRANRLARHLQRLGVVPDMPVGVCLERTSEIVVALVGILKAGGAYLALDASHPAERLRFMVQDAGASIVITERSLAGHLGEMPNVRRLVIEDEMDALAREDSTPPSSVTIAASLAYVAYTSGTTGTPKGAAITHRAVNRLVCGIDYIALGPETAILHAAPLAFDASTLEIWGPLLNGGRCVVYPDPVPTARGLAASIRRHGVDTLWLTCSLFNAVVDEDPSCLAGVRQLLTGGEALSVAHVRRAQEALPDVQIFNGYGPTECTTFTTVYPIPRELPEDVRAIPIGKPIRDTTLYVVDEAMRPVPLGVAGELYVGGAGLARGYVGRPDLTAEKFVPDPFAGGDQRLYRTGDLVRWRPDGALDFVGRVDSQVKIRGFRIEPGEIEAALVAHPSVQSVFVQAREDRPGVKRLVAYLVAQDGVEPVRPGALREFLAASLPEFMVPAAFVWLPALPVNANGKVDAPRLPTPPSDRPQLEQEFVAARRPTEAAVVTLFESILDVHGLGIRDNFFELGGNSLLALKLLARVRSELGVDVPAVWFFQQPTAEAVASSVERGGESAASSAGARRRAVAPSAHHEDVAIIGMGGRFPGASSVARFWENVCKGVESISLFSDSDLDPSLPPSVTGNPAYVRARGILDDVEMFDAAFFGIPPREAEVMDPQHRLFLEVAWEVLEEAGYVSEEEAGRIGVFGGMYNGTYFQHHVSTRPDLIERVGAFQVMVGNEKDYVPTRVAHRLNLTGPAVSVHTACSTSLVSVVLAFQNLRAHLCDLALAGGAAVTCPPKSGYLYQEGAMLSPDGHTRAFDADAQGTVFSDGVSMLLLKRLSDALADGDTIYGVIRGAAINNDGGIKASFTAPSVEGQAAVIRAAQEIAGVEPRAISYVETHGTATPLGDPIEVEALHQVFGRDPERRRTCAIGSVKSNIGHTVIAAGGAGLIKTALALTHRMLPPSLFYVKPNPKIDFESGPFYVNSSLAEWPAADGPRLAGVSAFGVGGTNAHVVVEEPPVVEASGPSRPAKLLLLSARTPAALERVTERLRDHLAERPDVDLADVAYTLMAGRRWFAHRRAIVASDVADAVTLLGGADPARVATARVESSEPGVSFLFPGQGTQYVGMGSALYRDEPTYRAMVDHCAEVLQPEIGRDLRALLFADESNAEAASESLRNTAITQPALFVTEYALAQLLMSWGVRPSSMIGHSVGEFVAATIAGVMGLEDALRLVAIRGRLMAAQPAGAMLSVRLGADSISSRLGPNLAVASDNGPGLCVIAGPSDEITLLETSLGQEGVVCRQLQTSHAFHSPMMDDVVDPFTKVVQGVALRSPRIPFVSTATADWIRSDDATSPEYWARHLRATVRFREGVAVLLAEPGSVLLEVGPRATLSTLSRRQVKNRSRVIIASLGDGGSAEPETTALLRAAGQLWLAGVRLDPRGFHVHERRRRVPLPTYPFERKRFWIDPPAATEGGRPAGAEPARAEPATATGAPAAAAPTPVPSPPTAPALDRSNGPIHLAEAPPAVVPAEVPATGAVSMSTSSSVKASLLTGLKDLFEEISGIEFGAGDESVTFMEIGLDSLSLTQIAQQVEKTYKVKVTFRQLMEDYPSLETLAANLEGQMPSELLPKTAPAPAETPAAAPAPTAVAAPTAPAPTGAPPAGVPTMPAGWPAGAYPAPIPAPMAPMPPWGLDPQTQWMMQQQWLQMQYWMAARGQQMPMAGMPPAPWAPPSAAPAPAVSPAPTAGPAAAERPAEPAAASPAPAAPASESSAETEASPTGQVKYDAKKAFGAQTRIHTHTEEFTPRQKARLDVFVRRYTARTRRSKEYTQKYRRLAADPRAVTGFRPSIKELIYPIVAKRSKGAYLWDIDDNQYIDILSGFGANYFGWQPDFVNDAVKQQLDEALAIGPQTPLLGEVAELFCEMTGAERAAFCNTGSEAVMGCMRLARTATGRSTIAFFTGSYHGIFDEVIVRATKKGKAYPASPGILPNTAENVLILDYGTPEALEIIRSRADELAAVLVEPVQSRRPDLQPREFLHELRRITEESGTALIFDEVITGFRTGPRGAQGFFDIQADLASYGKVIGGGYSLGVIGGKSRFMDGFDGGHWQFGDDSIPTAGVTYFAGTFVRHPMALAAARAVLHYLKKEGPQFQERLNARTAELAGRLRRTFEDLGAPLTVNHFSTLWRPAYVQEQPHGELLSFLLRDRGIHNYDGFPCFLTTAHSDADLDAIVAAFSEAIREMQEGGFLPEPVRRPKILDASHPPVPGARLGRDENGDPAWFLPNPESPGKFLKVS